MYSLAPGSACDPNGVLLLVPDSVLGVPLPVHGVDGGGGQAVAVVVARAPVWQ